MPTKTYDRRHDHSRDTGGMADRFPANRPDRRHAPAPNSFEPKEVLRRTGFRLADEGRAAHGDLAGIGRTLERVGAGDFTGQAGNAFVVVIGGLLALIFLDLLLGKRGSSITSAAIRWTGGAIGRLVDPADPLTGRGATIPPNAPANSSTSGSSGASAPNRQIQPKGDSNGAVPWARYGEPLYPTPSGREGPIAGSSYTVDSAYTGFVGWIAKHFGVTVTSGYRTASENAAAGGAPNSDHLKGLAADFGGSPAALERLYRWALAFGFPYVESPAQALAAGEGAHVHISFYRP